MPHFHLPLQSGANAVLRKMNRQYDASEYREMVARLKAAFDRPALTTDVIVGFPGEGEAEFAQTVGLAREVGFLHIHAFPYSPRMGTAAARWQDQAIPQCLATERMRLLEDLSRDLSLAYRRQFEGQKARVLVERSRGGEVRHGRCERYFEVHFEAQEDLEGRLVEVEVARVTAVRATGRLLRVIG
jgi:threonylcarbamoyladenosine tRNA methylthiotransferase MtaB